VLSDVHPEEVMDVMDRHRQEQRADDTGTRR
jgi:hypothetical protein